MRVRPVERTGELSITAPPGALSGIDLFPVSGGELSISAKLLIFHGFSMNAYSALVRTPCIEHFSADIAAIQIGSILQSVDERIYGIP